MTYIYLYDMFELEMFGKKASYKKNLKFVVKNIFFFYTSKLKF